VAPLIYSIFYTEFKQGLISHLLGHIKNFSHYTNFYRVNKVKSKHISAQTGHQIFRTKSLQSRYKLSSLEKRKTKYSLILTRNYDVRKLDDKISFVKQYILQRRWYKEKIIK
jgi:hypothetical protein